MFCRFKKLLHSEHWQLTQGLGIRYFSDQKAGWKAAPLPGVAIIRVAGAESATFLQGLITNDIVELGEETAAATSLYCMFLNTGGRVLFDSILSRGWSPGEYLLQVDSQLASMAVKHLSLYRVRRKIVIEPASELQVSAIFSHQLIHSSQEPAFHTRASLIGSTYCDGGASTAVQIEPPLPLHSQEEEEKASSLCLPDPRLDLLGYRLIRPAGQSSSRGFSSLLEEVQEAEYHAWRFRVGVAEGGQEIVAGKALPLEYNLDYLRGVSFHKGCYLGQELTARTHHTGVIRKRVLPLETLDPGGRLPVEAAGTEIRNQLDRSVGRLLAATGGHGLAMIRLQEGFAADSLSCGDQLVRLHKPVWWPPERKRGGLQGTTKAEE